MPRGANKIEPERRAQIIEAIRAGAGHRSATSIGKEFQVSRTTVTTIAAENDMGDAFDRSKTANAAAAKQVDNRARRAALVQSYLDDAEKIRERIHEQAEFVTVTGDIVHLSRPGARDVRDFVVAGTSLLKMTIEVEKHDTGDTGADDAKSMLGRMVVGLATLYDAEDLRGDSAAPPERGAQAAE